MPLFSTLFPLYLSLVLSTSLLLTNMLPAQAATQTRPTPVSELADDRLDTEESTKTYDQGVTVSRVEFEGNRLIEDAAIQEVMAIRPGSLYERQSLQQDLKRIYDMGYFTEKIKAVPEATSQGVVLKIRVEENVPITGVSIEGNSQLTDEELQTLFNDQTGLPQNVTQLNDSIRKIEELYAEKGYVLARVTDIEDDPDGMVNLKVSEGTVGKIDYVGNRKTKDHVLKRNMLTKVGEAYNEKVLADDLKRLFATQAFDDVRRVITVSPTDPNAYNLVVEVDEKRSGALSVGGGFDTGTGLFGTVGYNDPNFLGRGESFNSAFAVGSGVIGRDETQADARTYQFEVGWSTPSFKETVNAVAVGASARDVGSFNVPLAIERRIGTQVSVSRPLLSTQHMSASLGLGIENVRIREGGSQSDLDFFGITDAQRADQLDGGGTFLSLTPTVAFDSRDNRFDPTKGWFTTVSTTGALGLGTDSYGTLTANVRKYVKLNDNITLAVNTQAGTNLLGDIPEFNMFRLGGAYSVRGFQEGGLGTGTGFLIGSAELRTKVPFISRFKEKAPFLDSVRLAFFMDGGTFLEESDLNSVFGRDGNGVSAGFGLRVNLPGLGPIRVDYAVPLTDANDLFTRRFNFAVGQKF